MCRLCLMTALTRLFCGVLFTRKCGSVLCGVFLGWQLSVNQSVSSSLLRTWTWVVLVFSSVWSHRVWTGSRFLSCPSAALIPPSETLISQWLLGDKELLLFFFGVRRDVSRYPGAGPERAGEPQRSRAGAAGGRRLAAADRVCHPGPGGNSQRGPVSQEVFFVFCFFTPLLLPRGEAPGLKSMVLTHNKRIMSVKETAGRVQACSFPPYTHDLCCKQVTV